MASMKENLEDKSNKANGRRKRKIDDTVDRLDETLESPPNCNCNLPACQRIVRKEGPNKGRKFWGCAQWSPGSNQKGCKFFEWQDEEKQVIQPKAVATASKDKAPPATGLAVKVVTMNVAEFKPHCLAPRGFDPQEAFEKELERHRPDILALQELPPYESIPFFPGYECMGTTPSHCGLVGLFLRHEFLKDQKVKAKRMSVPSAPVPVPAVVARIRRKDDTELIVGSCHLAPYKDGREKRIAQLGAISGATSSAKSNQSFILAGDMNMRQDEDAAVESIGSWKDAWKEAGSIRREAYTWNSKINQYHGTDSYQFHCRFDRVYLRNAKCVRSFQLMADEPKENGGSQFYISDHFGIVTTIML